ncbi:MAG: HAMP domain-containing histidine kinase [Lachnospiraceae bacterium]|nr:HAMP domain-containing histidine kinase [Lachnospiraceae bacterium]
MKRIKSSITVKVVAIILFVLSLWVTVGSVVGIVALYEEGIYTGKNASITESIYESIMLRYGSELSHEFMDWKDAIDNADGKDAYYYQKRVENFEKKYSAENTNYYCVIKDMSGNVIFRTGDIGTYSYTNGEFFSAADENGDYTSYYFEAYVRAPKLANDEFVLAEKFGDFVNNNKYTLIFILAGSILLEILLFVFLMCSAGHRKGQEGVNENFFDKIPFDVLLVAIGFVVVLLIDILDNNLYLSYYYNYYRNVVWDCVLIFVCSSGVVLSVMAAFMTFATRFKLGTVFSNMLIVRVCKLVIKGIKYVGRLIAIAFKNIDVLWKVGIVYAVMTFFELFMMLVGNSYYWSSSYFGFILIWLLAKLFVAGVLVIVLINFKQVRIAAEKLAEGDINYKADTKYMQWDIKKHAETLNSIGGGLSKAVDEKMKSERLKTELITNVSHDIKTPLTSIINYVDLLKKEELDNEKAQEYLEVLDRQSNRLKKLTEDLVEASKASTGNISVDKQETELGVLLSQAVGEYEERIYAAGLTPIVRIPEEPITIMTDGRLLWRVFDNLLGNICKYSMPDTRVYIELQAMSKEAVFVFRNISKYELNVSSDELMERFVRGDSSRNTEGSGLGLSIAKSLVDLLGGTFTLSVDGDLFKVILQFPL